MIPYVDSFGKDIGCKVTPFMDLVTDIGLIVSGLVVLNGLLKTPSNVTEGLGTTLIGAIGVGYSSFTKAQLNAVQKSCYIR